MGQTAAKSKANPVRRPVNVRISKRRIESTPVQGDAIKIPGITPDAYVIGQDLYTAASTITSDLKHKITQCLSYAYGVADGTALKAPLEVWYRQYFTALQTSGLWIPTGRISWKTDEETHVGVTVHSAIVDLIGGLLTNGTAAKLAKDALTALNGDAQSSWFTLFDLACKRIEVPSCQITIAVGGGDLPVRLHVLAYAADIREIDGQFLFFRFTSRSQKFQYYYHSQEIDEQGLRDITRIAPLLTARIGTLGPV